MGIAVDEVFKEGASRLKQELASAVRVVKQTLRELGIWGIPFALTHLAIGLLPISASLLLGSTVDSLIGSRGVGVMTTELTTDLWRFGALVLVVFVSYIFTTKFTGAAAVAGYILGYMTAASTLMIGLAYSDRWAFLLAIILINLALMMYGAKLSLRIFWLCLALVAAVVDIGSVINFTVSRSFTVGEGLMIVSLIVWCTVLLKLRLIRTS